MSDPSTPPSESTFVPPAYPRLDEPPSTLQQSIIERARESDSSSRFTRKPIVWVWIAAALLAIVPIAITLGTADLLVRLMYRAGARYAPTRTEQPAPVVSSDPDVVILQSFPSSPDAPAPNKR
jgi:hypothetical protein